MWYLEFEGTFHYTQIWINGHHILDHELGYTPYSLRLDNLSGILVPGVPATLALRADASYGSGHWYFTAQTFPISEWFKVFGVRAGMKVAEFGGA